MPLFQMYSLSHFHHSLFPLKYKVVVAPRKGPGCYGKNSLAKSSLPKVHLLALAAPLGPAPQVPAGLLWCRVNTHLSVN